MTLWGLAIVGLIVSIACFLGGLSYHASLEKSIQHAGEFRSIEDKVNHQLKQGLAVVDPDLFPSESRKLHAAYRDLIESDQVYRNLAFTISAISLVASGLSAWWLLRRFPGERCPLRGDFCD